jgi:hypothetical protein
MIGGFMKKDSECDVNLFTAKLISIISVEEGLKSEVADCIRMRANLDNRKLNNNDIVAVLNISGTTSYQVFFIDDGESINYIKKSLNEINTSLNYDSEEILKRYINRIIKK